MTLTMTGGEVIGGEPFLVEVNLFRNFMLMRGSGGLDFVEGNMISSSVCWVEVTKIGLHETYVAQKQGGRFVCYNDFGSMVVH